MKFKLNARPILEIDYAMLGATLTLVAIGILFVYSAGVSADAVVPSSEYVKQIVWALTGLVLLFLVAIADYSRTRDLAPYIYFGMLALLVVTRLFGKYVHGARAWLGLFGDFGIQPSEFMKVATILMLARYFDMTKHSQNPISRFAVSFLIFLAPVTLILIQPDMGTALVYFPIFIAMAYIAGIERRYVLFVTVTGFLTILLIILPQMEKYIFRAQIPVMRLFTELPYAAFLAGFLGAVLAAAYFGWKRFRKKYYYWILFVCAILLISVVLGIVAGKVLQDYQVKRLIVFLDPSIDAQGSGWNIRQSVYAIGSGGFAGKGFLSGTQSRYNYLPEKGTDFIFSVLSEEWGFLGGFLVFSLFAVIFARGIGIIRAARDPFGSNIVAGVLAMIFFHLVVNVGMTMGIMPITGIPLMFLSYGGSSLWTGLVSVGLMLGVYVKRFRA